jgi:hypothetical protein
MLNGGGEILQAAKIRSNGLILTGRSGAVDLTLVRKR